MVRKNINVSQETMDFIKEHPSINFSGWIEENFAKFRLQNNPIKDYEKKDDYLQYLMAKKEYWGEQDQQKRLNFIHSELLKKFPPEHSLNTQGEICAKCHSPRVFPKSGNWWECSGCGDVFEVSE